MLTRMSATMSQSPRPRGGRRSRGDRVTLTTKLPRSYEPKMRALLDHTGESVTDYVATLIMRDLDSREVPTSNGQEVFDLKSA
ncbi:hypothetical protein C6558_38890 [Ensifer sp. NM-2]|nr:hypothetical protein C6558_38890 [Ensifer sp. NM-2]